MNASAATLAIDGGGARSTTFLPSTEAFDMERHDAIMVARLAILAIAEIKEATRSFDKGETNVFETLAAILAACDDYRERTWRRPDAA